MNEIPFACFTKRYRGVHPPICFYEPSCRRRSPGGTENGHAQPTENMRYVTITTVRPTTRGADPIDSPYSVLSVDILELNFQAFMTVFGLGFGTIQDKPPLSLRIEAKPARKLECG